VIAHLKVCRQILQQEKCLDIQQCLKFDRD
jgi:hypothetical protein